MPDPTPKAYRCALAGLGRIAWQFDADNSRTSVARTHAGAYVRQPKTRIVGGFSPCEKDRAEFQAGFEVPIWSEFDELLRAEPDVVSICSPSEHHFEQAMACVERNVPMVWLEKPPTLNLEDLDALLRRLEVPGTKTKVLVNYSRRYSYRYSKLQAVLQERLLGKPMGITVSYSRGLELNGSHFLDRVFMLLGDTKEFEVIMDPVESQSLNPSFLLRTEAGFPITFCGFDSPYHVNDILYTAEAGRVSLLSGGLDVRVERKIPNKEFSGFFRLQEAESDLLQSPPDDTFSTALTDLLHAHETDSQPSSSLWTARNTQAVIARIRAREQTA